MYKTNSLHKMFSSIVLFFSPRNQHFAFAQGMKSPQNRGQICDLQVSEDLRKSEETRKLGKDIWTDAWLLPREHWLCLHFTELELMVPVHAPKLDVLNACLVQRPRAEQGGNSFPPEKNAAGIV